MERIIVLSEKDIQNIETGKVVKVKMYDGTEISIMDDIAYEKLKEERL